jgi:acetyl esterase/lipase
VLLAKDQAYGTHPRQRLDIYAPRKLAAGAKVPVIVWFYGGSWNSGSRQGYAFAGRALASRGFVVAVPDYRLVPEVRYPGFLEDGAAAVKWLRANIARHGGDPDRLVLAGHSAGAYNAAMLALDPRWLGSDRTAVRGLIGLAGPYDFLPLDVASTQNAFGHVADLPATQPVNHAGAGDPPALLVAGAEDTLVRPRQTAALAQRLKEAGVSAETRLYPGVGHIGVMTALSKPLRGKAPVLQDAADFAARVTAER